MKDRDVPQDDGACYAGARRLTYAVGEDGRYKGVASSGWEAEIEANAVFIQADNERIAEAWGQVRAGTASPLAYYLALRQMDVALLSAEVGIMAWRVRRHLRPGPFGRLGAGLLERYSDALGVDVARLQKVPDAPEEL